MSPVGLNPAARNEPIDEEDESSNSATSQSHYGLNGAYDPDNDDFDYEEYLAEEFPEHAESTRSQMKSWVWITAWVLIAATLLPFVYYFMVQ